MLSQDLSFDTPYLGLEEEILSVSMAGESPLPPLQVPGAFVVGQGLPGDGLQNALSVPAWRDWIRHHGVSLPNQNNPRSTNSDDRITTLLPASTYTDTPELQQGFDLWLEEERSVQTYHYKEWKESLRMSYRNANSNHDTSDWLQLSERHAFWQAQGQLALWSALPDRKGPSSLQCIGSLAPGTVLKASEIYQWDGMNLLQRILPRSVPASPRSVTRERDKDYLPLNSLRDQRGTCLILKVEAPQRGYCLYSMDGYPFLLPGGLDELAPCWGQSASWYWKVTCPSGAFVREGLELTTRHLVTLPYGTVVHVLRQRVNQAGLPRLQIMAHIYDSMTKGYRHVQGWCSTALNPLSGQRGPILQPLPLPRPMVYRVVLPQGAVIRQDVELASAVVGHARCGSWVTVVASKFTDFPADRAVRRLRLAGGGWISARLNHAPPHDLAVVEIVGYDRAYDPDQPHWFHYQAQHQALGAQREPTNRDEPSMADATSLSQMEAANADAALSADGTTGSSPLSPVAHPSATYNTTPPKIDEQSVHPADKQCLCCLEYPRNATLVHGDTGHIVCCLHCARVLKAQGQKCPVCRMEIDAVIKHFFG